MNEADEEHPLGRIVAREGVVEVRRDKRRKRYHAFHRDTGERLTPAAGQGSNEQAITGALLVLRRRARKRRSCLRCGRKFMSEGPGHRLCSQRCRESDAELFGDEYGALDASAIETK